jgi:2-oxoglutarate dehydrogenase E1 component
MTTQAPEPLLETLVNDFGGNYVFALDVLEQYRSDRRSVDASWREYFDKALGVPGEPPSRGNGETGESPSASAAPPEAARSRTLVRKESAGPPSRAPSKALVVPAILPGDIAQPIRGGAMRIVENMEASLSVPTATSIRTLPVRTLEENRRILNKHRESLGKGKVSFTHLVAWGILRALDTFPRLNDAYAELDGSPHRIQRDAVRLGVAVDVQKKDGTRTLLVPNIKDAGRMDFAAFLKSFDDLVGRSRKGTISPDDFIGTTGPMSM